MYAFIEELMKTRTRHTRPPPSRQENAGLRRRIDTLTARLEDSEAPSLSLVRQNRDEEEEERQGGRGLREVEQAGSGATEGGGGELQRLRRAYEELQARRWWWGRVGGGWVGCLPVYLPLRTLEAFLIDFLRLRCRVSFFLCNKAALFVRFRALTFAALRVILTRTTTPPQTRLDDLREAHERLRLESASEIRRLRREAREGAKAVENAVVAAGEADDQVQYRYHTAIPYSYTVPLYRTIYRTTTVPYPPPLSFFLLFFCESL